MGHHRLRKCVDLRNMRRHIVWKVAVHSQIRSPEPDIEAALPGPRRCYWILTERSILTCAFFSVFMVVNPGSTR